MPNLPQRKTYVPPEIDALVDQMGTFIQYWGFKKIHGLIWAHVWLAKTPIDATTLVQRLRVSKALVSLAIKDLLHYDVVKVLTEGDRRKILLVPNTDVQTVITNVLKHRESKMLANILKSQNQVDKLEQKIKEKYDLDEDRLEQMRVMTELANLALCALVKSNLDLEQFNS